MTEVEVIQQVGDGGALVLAAWCVLELRRLRATMTNLLERVVTLEVKHTRTRRRS